MGGLSRLESIKSFPCFTLLLDMLSDDVLAFTEPVLGWRDPDSGNHCYCRIFRINTIQLNLSRFLVGFLVCNHVCVCGVRDRIQGLSNSKLMSYKPQP